MFVPVTEDLDLADAEAEAEAEADAAYALLRTGVNPGPLHAMLYGLKDRFDTKGIVTGLGRSRYGTGCPTRMPPSPSACVRRDRAFGQDHGRRLGLQRHLIWRHQPQPVEPERRLQRVKCRVGLDHGGRAWRLFDRNRDFGVNHRAQPPLRDDWVAADLWPGLPR